MAKKENAVRVLFASFEVDPFFKSGGLGDVAGSLPGYISTDSFDIRVIMPKLAQIPDEYKKKMRFLCSFEVKLAWRRLYCGLFHMRRGGLDLYFIDNEFYFARQQAYGEADDGERMAFFSKALLESALHIDGFSPDIIHCNDWHTAMAPVFLREQYMKCRKLKNAKTVFTIHNLKFQGIYNEFLLPDVLGLSDTPAERQLRSAGDSINYMQAAVRYSDVITTVSPSYAGEICTPYYGEGLDWLFRERRGVLRGILNGIDYKLYDPKNDPALPACYDADSIAKRTANKKALCAELGFSYDPKIPLIVMISRLTEQKGLDLLKAILPRLMEEKLQLAVLGVGDRAYEDAFRGCAAAHPEKMAAVIKFDPALSRLFYGGADMLLVPSRFEPCGLTQMMAMRYGALPIVRETGGLKDSVVPYNKYTGEGTGFSFANYDAGELFDCIKTAVKTYSNKKAWKQLQTNAMTTDLSWRSSARAYRRLYRELLK